MSKVCLFNGKSSIINDLNDLTLDVIFGNNVPLFEMFKAVNV